MPRPDDSISSSPSSSSARSRMLANPRWPGWDEKPLIPSLPSMPCPLSATRSSTLPPTVRSEISTWLASAWRPAFTTASCAIRNRSSAISGGRSMCSIATRTSKP